MTDKSHELLEAALDHLHGMNSYEDCLLKNRIRAYLAEPEQDSLKDDEAWEKGFRQGIKFAKARYGITGGESND